MRSALPLFLLLPFAAQAQFGPVHNISASASFPTSMVVVDLDGDGINDILTASRSNSQVAWHPGTGSGLFGSQQVISNSLGGASEAAAADLDGDGDLDVVVVGYTADKVVWYANEGDGSFGSEQLLSTTTDGPWGVQAVDIDGDGLPEVIVSCADGDRITLYHDLGNGQFGTEQIVTQLVDNARRTATGDLDGDGDVDLVSTSASDNKVAWYANQGDGTFGPQIMISSNALWASDVFVVDMDGDGILDVLATSESSNKIQWFKNNGSGVFIAQTTIAITASVLTSAFPADLDGDGDLDVLATSNSDDHIAWYANDGSGQFGAEQLISNTEDNPQVVMAGDVDNDGDMDVVSSAATADRLSYFANNGSALFDSAFLIGTAETSNVQQSVCADLNGDGSLDVAVVSVADGKLSWYANSGDGQMGPQQVIATAAGLSFLIALDVDGDGDIDLISGKSFTSSIGISLNDGTGQFSPRTQIPGAPSMFEIASGDVDDDGDVDLLLGYVDEGWAVALNDGSGNFILPAFIDPYSTYHWGINLVDVDEDGDLDVLDGNLDAGKYEWYANDGNGNFGPSQLIGPTTSTNIEHILWADLNGDGHKDLIAATSIDNLVSWIPNLGSGVFGTAAVAFPMNSPYGLDVADLDGDGDMDLAATSFSNTGGVFYSLNNGIGEFNPPVLVTSALYGALDVRAADLNGDGYLDLVVCSNLDDRVTWYQNYFGSQYHMEGRLYHDLNGNGQPESDEPAVLWVGVESSPYSSVALTDTSGHFVIYADSGDHQVHAILPSAFWQVNSIPPYQEASLTYAQPVATDLDLGIIASVDTSLIVPSLQAMPAVCGDTSTQYLSIANQGTRIEHGRITLDLDTFLGFVNSVPVPDVATGNHYEWNFTDLGYEEVRSVVLTVIRPVAFFSGDTLHSQMHVLREDVNDAVTDTFPYAWSQKHLCSFDPNDKSVAPRGTGPMGIIDIDTQYLDYTIRFQNTGTAPAQDVVLRDTLDEALAQGTVEVLGYSHTPSQITIAAGGELVVKFNGIALPDSGSDQLGSQGFFSFRIHLLPDPANGTRVSNQARIFFDLNAPVLTNVTVNTLVDCGLYSAVITDLGNGQFQASEGSAYQWYVDGAEIPDATNATIEPSIDGYYTVAITGPFDCVAQSDPLYMGNVGITEMGFKGFRISPNPSHDLALLHAPHALAPDCRIELLDVCGRSLRSFAATGGLSVPLDVSSLPSGVYMLRIAEAGGERSMQRFVVD